MCVSVWVSEFLKKNKLAKSVSVEREYMFATVCVSVYICINLCICSELGYPYISLCMRGYMSASVCACSESLWTLVGEGCPEWVSVCISVYVSSQRVYVCCSLSVSSEAVHVCFSLSVTVLKKTRWTKFKMAKSMSVERECMFSTAYVSVHVCISLCVYSELIYTCISPVWGSTCLHQTVSIQRVSVCISLHVSSESVYICIRLCVCSEIISFCNSVCVSSERVSASVWVLVLRECMFASYEGPFRESACFVSVICKCSRCFMLRVTIMSLIFLSSKEDILTPQFTIDAVHVDKSYKNNPDVQPDPEPNKLNDEKPSWRDGESGDTGTDSTPAPKSSGASADDIPTTQPSDSLYVSIFMLSVRVISYGYIYMYMTDPSTCTFMVCTSMQK